MAELLISASDVQQDIKTTILELDAYRTTGDSVELREVKKKLIEARAWFDIHVARAEEIAKNKNKQEKRGTEK